MTGFGGLVNSRNEFVFTENNDEVLDSQVTTRSEVKWKYHNNIVAGILLYTRLLLQYILLCSWARHLLQCLSPPRSINGYQRQNAGSNATETGISSDNVGQFCPSVALLCCCHSYVSLHKNQETEIA